MITVANDNMCRELESELASDHTDLSESDLWVKRDATASHYMLYAVKPLSPNAHDDANAREIRARRTELLKALWLHLDALCQQRDVWPVDGLYR